MKGVEINEMVQRLESSYDLNIPGSVTLTKREVIALRLLLSLNHLALHCTFPFIRTFCSVHAGTPPLPYELEIWA